MSRCHLCHEDKEPTIGVLLCADCTLDAILGKAVRRAVWPYKPSFIHHVGARLAKQDEHVLAEFSRCIHAIAAALEAENENV